MSLRHGAAALFFAAICAIAQPQGMTPQQQLAHDIYKQLIEINTSYSTGTTTPAAEAMAARLRAAGFPDSDIVIAGASAKKQNLVVRYHGSGARKPILLLAHTDVVEARPSDWSMDPFQLDQIDGYFYGRGTSDDKAQAAIWIANLIRYKQEGFKPDRDIIVALTADEEGGGPYNGVQWLLKNRRDLIDADFALNEGGWGEADHGRPLSNDVQVSEKYVIDYRLEVRNKGGHSSLPVPDNAIYRLAAALTRLAAFGFPLKTNEVTRAYFEKMSRIETGPVAAELGQVAQGSEEAMQRVAAASPMFNATLRTTCVATQIEGGHAANALPQLAAANVNCRVMAEDSVEYVTATLRRVIDDPQVKITVRGEVTKGPPSPMRPDIMRAIEQASNDVFPSVPVVPIMLMAATDGLYLRADGIPTYGVQGIFIDRDDLRMHGKDERVRVKAFYDGEQFLYDLVKRLSS
jgi:acetylornithine deacetylase/succinyl-diaminopimelate desuccinylase-like protein